MAVYQPFEAGAGAQPFEAGAGAHPDEATGAGAACECMTWKRSNRQCLEYF